MSSDNWNTDQVMQCLDGMGISVDLVVRGLHRFKAGAQLDWHDKQFIDKHYFKIKERLVDDEIARRKRNEPPVKMTQEVFRQQLSRVLKKGLDAVIGGEMTSQEMTEMLNRIQPLVESIKDWKPKEGCNDFQI